MAAGKYIRGLFVELNDSKECIRAFCFSDLWKKRIIQKYNTLFNDKMGKELPSVYSNNSIRIKISSWCSIIKFKKEIEKMKSFLNQIQNRVIECNPDYKNTNMLYECFGSGYIRTIKEIEKLALYLGARYMIITGTAGNGKSMMLCSVAELLLKRKETVLFINARDVKEDFISYLKKQSMKGTAEIIFVIWWKLQSFLHLVKRKNIYILVDAINENDEKKFLESFSKSIEKLLGFGHVKVIICCRSEYYDQKYKKYVMSDVLEHMGCYLDLQEGEYSYEAKERLISNYAQQYKFIGELAESVKEKITKQLLLVRIFFEVYAGKSDNVLELNKYELYKTYIDNTDKAELSALIKKLAEYMLDNEIYENVPLSKLGQQSSEYAIIDSSILVCRNLIKHRGTLREDTEEVINFVYDEMRDYMLSKQILDLCDEGNGSIDYKKVKRWLKALNTHNAKCLSGVINYMFCHCMSEGNQQMIEFLLFELIKARDDQIDRIRQGRDRQITSWGLTLLLETDSINTSQGEKYVDYILQDNPGNESKRLLVYLIKQELKNRKYTLNILLDAFLRADSKELFMKRVDNTLASWGGEGVTVHNLIKIYEKLTETNLEGAARFSVYAFLIVQRYDWASRLHVQEYFDKKYNSEMVNNYKKKIKERYC